MLANFALCSLGATNSTNRSPRNPTRRRSPQPVPGQDTGSSHERRRRPGRGGARGFRHAAHRHGHCGAGAQAGTHPARRAQGHGGGLPPLRHRGALRDRGAHRRGRRRGRAVRRNRLPRRPLHHLQALVQRRAPRQGAPRPQADAPEPSDGVRGPVPGPLARDHEAGAVQGPLHRRRFRAVRHADRVGSHGGVPPPGPREVHRRLQPLLQEAPGPALLRHHPSRRQPGGGEPGVAAEEAERVLQGERHPDLRLLAAGRQRHALGQRLRHGLRRAARHRPCQGQDRSPGVPEVGVRARRLPDSEELRRGEDAGEPGHRRLGADGGGKPEDRRHPAAEDQPGPPLRLRAGTLQVARRALGRRYMSITSHRSVFPGADRRAARSIPTIKTATSTIVFNKKKVISSSPIARSLHADASLEHT